MLDLSVVGVLARKCTELVRQGKDFPTVWGAALKGDRPVLITAPIRHFRIIHPIAGMTFSLSHCPREAEKSLRRT